jgi:hypothetical protein
MHNEYAIVIPNLELVVRVAFGRDNPNTTVQFIDIGHFALPKCMLKNRHRDAGFLGKLPHQVGQRSVNGAFYDKALVHYRIFARELLLCSPEELDRESLSQTDSLQPTPQRHSLRGVGTT